MSVWLSAGDLVWAELDPVLGSEQAGRRPVLLLTDDAYHSVSTRAVVCPVTRSQSAWPFNVSLPGAMATRGQILVDQVRTVHRASRLFDVIEKAPPEVMLEVRQILAALLGLHLPVRPEAADP